MLYLFNSNVSTRVIKILQGLKILIYRDNVRIMKI